MNETDECTMNREGERGKGWADAVIKLAERQKGVWLVVATMYVAFYCVLLSDETTKNTHRSTKMGSL